MSRSWSSMPLPSGPTCSWSTAIFATRSRDFARFVAAGYDNGWDMVLPLWCRPWGHANTTNYLAVPAVRAVWGGVRHRRRSRLLAPGASLVSKRRHLPNDYGIDIALTMAVLEAGGHLGW